MGEEVDWANEMSGNTVNDIHESLKNAAPFLPPEFITDSALIVLEGFAKSSEAVVELVAELQEFVKEIIASHNSKEIKALRKRWATATRKLDR